MGNDPLESRVNKLEDKVIEMDKNLTLISANIQSYTKSLDSIQAFMKEVSDTMQETRITLVNVQNAINTHTDALIKVSEDRKEQREKNKCLDEEIEKLKEKGKIDWMDIMKSSFASVLIQVIGAGAVMAGIIAFLINAKIITIN